MDEPRTCVSRIKENRFSAIPLKDVIGYDSFGRKQQNVVTTAMCFVKIRTFITDHFGEDSHSELAHPDGRVTCYFRMAGYQDAFRGTFDNAKRAERPRPDEETADEETEALEPPHANTHRRGGPALSTSLIEGADLTPPRQHNKPHSLSLSLQMQEYGPSLAAALQQVEAILVMRTIKVDDTDDVKSAVDDAEFFSILSDGSTDVQEEIVYVKVLENFRPVIKFVTLKPLQKADAESITRELVQVMEQDLGQTDWCDKLCAAGVDGANGLRRGPPGTYYIDDQDLLDIVRDTYPSGEDVNWMLTNQDNRLTKEVGVEDFLMEVWKKVRSNAELPDEP
ncbi:hypothetical protein Bbelb_351290 [Branchiostoma belcheri]|nr:hypothetical protein Bbelb_351290 [Branchiostoma belcheri]